MLHQNVFILFNLNKFNVKNIVFHVSSSFSDVITRNKESLLLQEKGEVQLYYLLSQLYFFYVSDIFVSILCKSQDFTSGCNEFDKSEYSGKIVVLNKVK